jgi:hypothetical protein
MAFSAKRPRVGPARRDGDRALPRSGQERVDVEDRTNPLREAEPLQAGEREQGRADRARLGLAQPCLDIAAQEDGLEIGAKPQRLGLTAKRRRAEGRFAREVLDRIGPCGDERVAHVFTRQIGGDDDALGHERGQVLGRVHGGVDRAREERGVNLLGEQALAAGLGERAVLDRIAAHANDLERDPVDLPA